MLTLRYLASGDSPRSLFFSYRIGITVHEICSYTCLEIWNALVSKGFLTAPSSPYEWLKVAGEFNRIWNFPNCCGAIDGKQIKIQATAGSGSLYYNGKHWHGIVLMAIAVADFSFILVNIGDNVRHSDEGCVSEF